MPKTLPMSVRLSHEDAEFLASLDLEGAATPSDKLRALVGEARQRREGVADYWNCLQVVHDMMGPALRAWRQAEHQTGRQSELVAHLSEWLPQTLAYFITQAAAVRDQQGRDGTSDEALRQLEAGLADRLFALLEHVLRLGVTPRCRGYDPQVIGDRLEPILELARVILKARPAPKEQP